MKEFILDWCKENNVAAYIFTPYQTRLKLKGITVDIFWKNMRYHIIKHPVLPAGPKERGDINDAEVFLESIFNNY